MTHYTNPYPVPPGSNKNWVHIIALGAAVLTFLICCGGIAFSALGGADPGDDRGLTAVSTPEASPYPSPGKPAAKSAQPTKTIDGDDVVHVGEDVPAGTYRALEAIDSNSIFSLCLWRKSSDAEGSRIIDIGTPTGGRPQVTLRDGQWFSSTGCPKWGRR